MKSFNHQNGETCLQNLILFYSFFLSEIFHKKQIKKNGRT